MSSHEIPEIYDPVEGSLEFDEDICCALKRGFEQNPSVVKELESVVKNKDEIRLLQDSLSNPDEIDPTFSEEMKIVYSQIAKRELGRTINYDEDKDLLCGHSVDEHILALKEVLAKMEPKVN